VTLEKLASKIDFSVHATRSTVQCRADVHKTGAVGMCGGKVPHMRRVGAADVPKKMGGAWPTTGHKEGRAEANF